ncbi:GNAT family N-acetyltransferase [uncultured Amnibacterium sp.]|uniref:GNAT family N-acetyltransferase n=1 Tax=uncultured Amnibacterium sp. TaxID=1631851 RepID=UPI0035C99C63
MPSEIRSALDADLDLLAGIEDAADRRFVDLFRPERWDAAPSGRVRAAQPGFVLVAAERPSGPPIGFVHVLEHDGAHLEQLAVLPEAGRRGHGRALVRAALVESARRGHERVTLRTYADVPWNAPFYASLGFVESEPDTPFLRGLVATEARLGLDRHGRRVQLTASSGVPGPR